MELLSTILQKKKAGQHSLIRHVYVQQLVLAMVIFLFLALTSLLHILKPMQGRISPQILPGRLVLKRLINLVLNKIYSSLLLTGIFI